MPILVRLVYRCSRGFYAVISRSEVSATWPGKVHTSRRASAWPDAMKATNIISISRKKDIFYPENIDVSTADAYRALQLGFALGAPLGIFSGVLAVVLLLFSLAYSFACIFAKKKYYNKNHASCDMEY